jgi:hypothetical protein
MKKLLLSFLLVSGSLAAQFPPLMLGQEENVDLIVNNQILAKVNGKPISVIDIMKKMDILFLRRFPEYTRSKVARYQFYMANWKPILNELIEKELILADAQEKKIPVSSGDVRQEMETMFGPNIIGNLDKVGLTFDEAWKIVQGDITIKRMIYVRVNSIAGKLVTPQKVREGYEKVAKESALPPRWKYQVISIRDENATQAAEAANLIHHLIAEENVPTNDLKAKLADYNDVVKGTQINISEVQDQTEKEVSEAYRLIFATLEEGQITTPLAQRSRDKSSVFRIFSMIEKDPGGEIPFTKLENEVRAQLQDEAVAAEASSYIKKLKRYYDVQEMHLDADHFTPFSLKY